MGTAVWVLIAVGGTLLLVYAGLVVRVLVRNQQVVRACHKFRTERASLQQKFFTAASASGKPRGLLWKSCEWEDVVEFARERQSGQLVAFASVTIQFEAIEGSDMEGLPAVGNLRNASAVFMFQGGRWQTAGRTVFNMNPGEALGHFNNQYERAAVG